jgi:hypothetical protein
MILDVGEASIVTPLTGPASTESVIALPSYR